MNEVTTQRRSPVQQFKSDLKALRDAGELDMLPSNVGFDAFRNAAVVAITDNPSILQCKRESVFKAVRRLAAAGLVPDGREAAIVPFKGEAQAMPMVAGLIKTARNSGEIVSIWADVVYTGEQFEAWVEDGERKFSHHYDPMERKGDFRGAYAVAKLKDGTIEVEPMDREQIEKRRRASANQRGDQPTGVWAQWYDEMAKKTVIRALCKRLPISSEDMRRMYVEHEDTQPIRDVTPEPEAPRKNLAQQIKERAEEPRSVEGEVLPPEEAEKPERTEGIDLSSIDPEAAFPGAEEFDEGVRAYKDGVAYDDCPHQDIEAATNWCGGWKQAERAAS